MSESVVTSLFNPTLPVSKQHPIKWGRLYGSSYAVAISEAAKRYSGPVVIVVPDTAALQRLDYSLRFYYQEKAQSLLRFPDWETLPYDIFSPHQDIISERLQTLSQLLSLQTGIVLVSAQTLMNRICPVDYISSHSFSLTNGQPFELENQRLLLEQNGYTCVSSVMEHGEFAVRGNIVDIFPMGSRTPFRLELFDEEIESIRTFDPETQRSIEKTDAITMLPAREFDLGQDSITRFRNSFRNMFEGDPSKSPLYRDVSGGISPSGIEYYLPLFFDNTASFFDYLPDNSLLMMFDASEQAFQEQWKEIQSRYEQSRVNPERPLLSPDNVFFTPEKLAEFTERFPRINLDTFEREHDAVNFSTRAPTNLLLDIRAEQPAKSLLNFLDSYTGRVLIAAETTGRREFILDLLHSYDLRPAILPGWREFIGGTDTLAITVAPLDQGLSLTEPKIEVISEPQLFGHQVLQRRRRKKSGRDSDAVVRNLVELTIGSPVVHEDHGVGRYQGLTTLTISDFTQEFLTLEYAGSDKLYVPVSSLHLISRYTGASPESAPLHKLGSGQWERAKRKASEKVIDVAAELLDIYARRAARTGFSYKFDEHSYQAFAASFPFEETPDQQEAIDNVIANMRSEQPMDHLVCGDVGFGKTEVAMRAAFIAVMAGKQVALLAPTTLLTQQHLENFRDRFSDWPVKIEALSRFGSKKEQDKILSGLQKGSVDIVIGTHKLLQPDVKFNRLGLIIIDEEHRFGVRQKEKFKSLRSEVDVLTLTATPIPRTLNMALSGMRELSIIATPPARRLAIKTFVSEWNDLAIREACLREIKRGGQVYFLHNDVQSIPNQVEKLEALVPEANIHYAHGQMRERELESIMSDFYHQRFNVLVCSTIIETGIDIPSANTIIINRADKFGLAQLYQLRGRVGRSHHRAYAYLITPPRKILSADAVKRLEAIESIQELGTGFTLASHDLEIRGAGELLGEEQSGQMQEIGYTLYTELLERAVRDLKEGKTPQLDKPLIHGAEVDLHGSSLIPEDYLPDVHERLILYKRISNCISMDELRDLQVEMIDRFGLLPESVKQLFQVTEVKLAALPLGITQIDVGVNGGKIVFTDRPDIDPMNIINLIQQNPKHYRLDGQNKLKIIKKIDSFEERVTQLLELIKVLSLKSAA